MQMNLQLHQQQLQLELLQRQMQQQQIMARVVVSERDNDLATKSEVVPFFHKAKVWQSPWAPRSGNLSLLNTMGVKLEQDSETEKCPAAEHQALRNCSKDTAMTCGDPCENRVGRGSWTGTWKNLDPSNQLSCVSMEDLTATVHA